MSKKNRSKILGTESIGKLLLKLSLPATVGMLVQALYNLVDTIFVGQGVGRLGIAGIAVVFPITMLVMAISMTIGVGGASVVSRALGAGDPKKASRIAGNVFTLAFVFSIVVMSGYPFIEQVLKIFGATPGVLPYAKQYLFVIIFGVPFILFSMAGNNLVRAEGNAKTAMVTMLIGAITNMILDPIFIFGLKMGISGAALATVVGQCMSFLYLLFYFVSGKSSIKIHLHDFLLHWKIVGEMLAVGSAAFARQVASSLMVAILNNSFKVYGGDVALAVFGVVFRLMMFVLMPMFGVIQGMQPIAGYNYGAKRIERVKSVVWFSVLITTLVGLLGFFVMMVFPDAVFRMFSSDVELRKMGIPAMRIIVVTLPIVGFQVVGGGFYQALGKALPSLILSMSRQILFLIPLVLILPHFYGLNGVWASFPLADALAFLFTIVMMVLEWRELTRMQRVVKTLKKCLP